MASGDGKWGRALLAATAATAGAYALLRAEEDRRKDLEAVDGALGGWVSWAIGAVAKPVAADAAEVQMESVPPMPAAPTEPSKPRSGTRQNMPPTVSEPRSGRCKKSGYPYAVTIEPAPAGAAQRWRLHITPKTGAEHEVGSARANQEARVAKLISGIETAQDRIQALREGSEPGTAAATSKRDLEQLTLPKSKQSKPQTKPQNQVSVKTKAKASAPRSAPVVETVAAPAAYSADYSWCPVELPVGPHATVTSSARLLTQNLSIKFGQLAPIAGGKCTESGAGPNEFVAWETQRRESVEHLPKATAPQSSQSADATGPDVKAQSIEEPIEARKNNTPVDVRTTADRVKNLADASLDSPNTRKKREEIEAKVAAATRAVTAPKSLPSAGESTVSTRGPAAASSAPGAPKPEQPKKSGGKKRSKKKKKR